MHLSRLRSRAFVALTAIIASQACSSLSSGPPDQLTPGSWGGEQIGVDVEPTRVLFLFDCAGGLVDHPIELDAARKFDVTGTFTGGGNAQNADHSSHAARYAGEASATRLRVTRTVIDGSVPTQTFEAVRGGDRHVMAC